MTESKSGRRATTRARASAVSAPAPMRQDGRPAGVHDPSTVLRAPLDAVRGLLPDSPVPVALGIGALAVGGVIEWPVAGAIGLGYLALRRWRPSEQFR